MKKKADRFERGPHKMSSTEKYSHWNKILNGRIKQLIKHTGKKLWIKINPSKWKEG